MQCNVGKSDKMIRLAAGAALAVGGLLAVSATLKAVLFVAAAVAVLTAVMGFCPLYRLIGIDTCKSS